MYVQKFPLLGIFFSDHARVMPLYPQQGISGPLDGEYTLDAMHVQLTWCIPINISSHSHTHIALTKLLTFTSVFSSTCYLDDQYLILASKSVLSYTSVQPIGMLSLYCKLYCSVFITQLSIFISHMLNTFNVLEHTFALHYFMTQVRVFSPYFHFSVLFELTGACPSNSTLLKAFFRHSSWFQVIGQSSINFNYSLYIQTTWGYPLSRCPLFLDSVQYVIYLVIFQYACHMLDSGLAWVHSWS